MYLNTAIFLMTETSRTSPLPLLKRMIWPKDLRRSIIVQLHLFLARKAPFACLLQYAA